MLADLEIRVGLFPGQGGYRKNALAESWSAGDASVRNVFEQIDATAARILGKKLSPRLFADEALAPDALFAQDPETLQLAVFGVALSVYRTLWERGARVSLLVGHSLGEIAALVAAGAFPAADGAELICHRISATSRVAPTTGGMVSLGCGEDTARQLLSLIGDPQLGVAVI